MTAKQVLVFIVGCFPFVCLAAEYQCNDNFPLVTDFSEEQCGDGEYYDANYYDCFPGCYTATTTICNPEPCPPGYTCPNIDDTTFDPCELDEDSCFKYQATESEYNAAMWKPDCTSDGKWAAKQCKGESTNGRCFCFDSVGTRIFGQAWISQATNMTCACSRRKAELLDEGKWYVSFHCDSMGNYEELQCDSELCWCAEPTTGVPTSAVVPETLMTYLPCYNATVIGEQYLRQCESQAYAQAKVGYELKIHGNNYPNFATLVCDDDGSYGTYKITNGIAYCVWRDNSILGAWQTEVTSSIGEVNCNCARDTTIFSNAGLTQNQQCQGNGNYKPEQQSGTSYYCVDTDGYVKSGYFDTSPTNCTSYY